MLDGADGMWNDENCYLPMNWICSISRSKLEKFFCYLIHYQNDSFKVSMCCKLTNDVF